MDSEILFEGLTRDEVLRLPSEHLQALLLTGQPILFSAGTARILGEFRQDDKRLQVVLAQIEGGGEGILPALSLLIGDYAKSRGLEGVEWIVHAVHCAKPNLKLKRVLERKGFAIRDISGTAAFYRYDLFHAS